MDLPNPRPQAGEVLLDVIAAGVNRADLMQREGRYPPPPGASEVLGLEVSGTVVAVGDPEDRAWLGQTVCTLLPGGAYAEQAVAPTSGLLPVPAGMDPVVAAGLAETYLTAFAALFQAADLKAGETVLIHAAASGVGTAALDLARLAGARAFATCGGAQKVAACLALGAEAAFDRHQEDFEEGIRRHLGDEVVQVPVGPGGGAGPGGIDVILDMVGAPYWDRNVRLANVKGRISLVSVLGGSSVEVNLLDLTSKRLTVHGITLRARSASEKGELTSAFLERFGADLAAGKIVPTVDAVLPLERAEEAHQRLERNLNVGKVVLQVR